MIEELVRFHQFVSAHPIGSKNPVGAWQRWLRWQLGSRLLNAPVIMPWFGGASLVLERGMVGATGNLYCGLHEFSDMALVLHYFGGGQGVFLDVGANVGSYTILAAKVVGAKVVTLEPVPHTYDRLVRHVLVNGIADEVSTHRLAVGEAAGVLKFSADRDAMNQVVGADYSGKSIEVEVVTLDALLGGRTSGLWKVDVEGFERQVLAGATRSLADPGVDVVLLEGDDADIKQTMRSHGFSERSYDPFSRTFAPASDDIPIGNHVWVRHPEAVEKRCRLAPKFVVHGVEF